MRMKVKLLRPLNGDAVGTESEYDKADAERLEASGAVEIIGEVKGQAKAEGAAPENKMEAGAAENKAAETVKAPTRRTARKSS